MAELVSSSTALLHRRLMVALSRVRVPMENERAAHDALERALAGERFDVSREVVLSPGCRIDLLVGNVGIEVKVDGARRDIIKQLRRYAAEDAIGALILITGRALGSNVSSIDGKPFGEVSLSQAWL